MRKKVIISLIITFSAIIFFALTAWAISHINDNRESAIRSCPECQKIADYLGRTGQWVSITERRTSSHLNAVNLEDLIAQLRVISPWLCDDCAYIRAQFRLLPPDDPQWEEYREKFLNLPQSIRIQFNSN